jgi:hypothetical protein
VRHAASPPARRRRKRGRARGPQLPGPPAEAGDADPPAGRPALPVRRRLAELLPYLIVTCAAGLSLVTMRQGEQDVRSGTLELAGAALAGAVARLALPERGAGLLASRRRLADVAAFAALGIGLLVAGLFFPVPA